jgi:hypothetical protein
MSDPKSILEVRRMTVGDLFLNFLGVDQGWGVHVDHVSHVSLANTLKNEK